MSPPHGHNKYSLRENDEKDQRSHYAVESARAIRLGGLTAPEETDNLAPLSPQERKYRYEDERRRTLRPHGDVKKQVDHQDVGYHWQHSSRTKNCRFAKQQQRTADKLSHPQYPGINM
jgi:hypothetical protein